MKYNINFKRQFENSWPITLHLFLWPIAFFILKWYNQISDYHDLFFLFFSIALFAMVFFVFQLIIHTNYYLLNKDDIFEYDKGRNSANFTHKGAEVHFNIEDIQMTVLYISFAMYKKNMQFLPWDSYYHFKFILKDGTTITITSLMVGEDFELPASKWRKKVKLSAFRLAKGPSLQLPANNRESIKGKKEASTS
jgi:hypothetical protein